MKNKLQQFIVKLLAATLAIIMAVPTNVFAMSQRKSNAYTAATSVMGIQTKDDTPEEVAETETILLKSAVSTEETTDYIIEKSASLSKTTGQVDYKIVVKTKDPSKEFTENQTTTFAITENTDTKDLKLENAQALDANGSETDLKYTLNTPNAFNNTDNLRTLGLTATKPQYGMVYYLSAQLTEEALKNLEEKSPQLALDFTIASPNQDTVQTRYSLETIKPDTTQITIDNDNNAVNQTPELVEKEDNLHLYKGEYKEEEKTLFQTTPAHLVWTDYINAKDDKEFAINFDLDENQDTENSQIKIDYYDAQDKGYVLNQSFSKTVDFTNSLNLTIPQGYIAKITLSTGIKENTNPKEYTFNGLKVANPSYKEETTEKTEEEQATDDADPLPDTSSKNDEEAKPSNDSIADESKQDFSQSPKSDTSAIALNKDAYLENLRNEEKLTENLEKAANDIELALESYNKEETNWDEFKATIQTIAKEQNLDQAQTEETLQALLAGLNEDKYKVANIDTKEATNLLEESTAQSEPTDATEKSVDQLVKEKLNEEGITIEDFQNYMYELEGKYSLTDEDAARIYGDNAEAIQALVQSYREDNTISDASNSFAVLDSGFSNENFITEIQYITTQLTSASNESKLQSLVQKYYGDSNPIDIIRNKYVGWKINLPGQEPGGRDIQELKTNGKYDFNALDFSLYAPSNQSLANYKVVIEDAGNGNVIATGIMSETGHYMTYGTSISKSSLPDSGLNIYVIAEAPVKRKEYNIGLKVSPDKNYVMALKEAFEEKFEELTKKYPLLIKYINTDQSEPFKNGINLVDTRMVYKEPSDATYQRMSNSTPFISTEYNDNNTNTDIGIGKNRVSIFGNLNQSGNLIWTVSELLTLETLENKSSIGRDAYTALSNGRKISPEVQLLTPNGSSYEVRDLGNISQTDLVRMISDIPGTIVNYTYRDTSSDIYSANTFKLASGKTASIMMKKIESGAAYTNQDTKNHSNRIHNQKDGKYYEQVLDLSNIMRAFVPKDTSIRNTERFYDPGVKENGVMVWCLTYGKADPSKARGFRDLLTKVQLDGNNPIQSGKIIYENMFKPKGETSVLYKSNMTEEDYKKVFDYIQRIFYYAEQMRNEKQLDEKTYSQIVQYNIYHFTSNRGETWYTGDVSDAGGSIKNMTEAEHNLALDLKNRVNSASGWDNVDKVNDVHIFIYSHTNAKYQQVISGDVHSKSLPKGNISIKKIDSDDNKAISNVGFKLTSVKDGKTYSGNTDTNGALSFNELPLGEYTLEETSAPQGYVLEKGKRTIFLTESNKDQAFSVTYYNRKSKIEFIKVDENGKIIPGATFELRKIGSVISGSDKTADSMGKFGWTGLRQGTYEVYEKSLPSGYENYKDNLGKKVAEFTIDVQNNVSTINNFTNSLNNKSNVIINKASYGNFKIKKVNGEGQPLEKVGFTLYQQDKKTPVKSKDSTNTEYLTNADGYLYFSNLPNGIYYLKETTIPEGYTAQNDGWTGFKVDNGNVTTINPGDETASGNTTQKDYSKVEISNTKPNNADAWFAYEIVNTEKPKAKFAIKKIDSQTQEILEGAEFTLSGGNLEKPIVKTTSTTENPVIFENLDVDKSYTLKETGVPAGYKDANEEYTVYIDKEGNVTIVGLRYEKVNGTKTFTIANTKIPNGRFRIEKVNESNKPLDGVTFTLTSDSNTNGISKPTDASGIVEFTNLTPGNYTLVESETKSGYIKTNQTWKVVVADNGATTISQAGVSLTRAINSIDISESYASELPATNKVNFVFIVENIKGKSENTIKQFNDSIETIRKDLADKYGSNATITLVSNGHQVMPGFDNGQPVIYANRPVTSNEEFKLVNLDQNGGDSHLDEAIKNARAAIKGNEADNYVFIMQSGNAEGYRYAFNNDKGLFTPEDNVKRSVMMFENASKDTIDAYTSGYRLGGLVSDKDAILTIDNQPIENIVKSQLTSSGVFEDTNNNTSEVTDLNVPDAQNKDLNNLEKLKSKGFIITNSSDYPESNISIIKVINKKPTYPSTGGSGTFIGFALIGTAIMIAGIAYYGIYVNDKNRRRSNRYGK
ncbi:SpaA isopeptide-forming pilin-related protein [Anaerococcus cruorum]|uniref:SpaA isopeptide-forming pilin-related protein n=1 Tax=Anaerococcus sp. WGS1529 TaxID=3366812 RepID=UPI00372D450A